VLGHLQLSIPWTSIWSSPTKIVIEDVYLLAEPKENVFDEGFFFPFVFFLFFSWPLPES
jgi:hypothetical protein